MKAFLLAAGRGERLRPLTTRVPKCLVPIAGRPLLSHLLDLCACHGVSDVLVNTHHLPDQVEAFVRDYRGPVRVVTSHEPELLGSAGTVRKNWSFVDGEPVFLVLYADNLTDVNLTRVVSFHLANEAEMTIGLYRAQKPRAVGIVEMDGGGRVVSFVEKPESPRSNLANAGIYVAGPALRSHIPAKPVVDFGHDVLPGLAGRMFGCEIREYLQDIGTPEAYERAEWEWRQRLPLASDGQGTGLTVEYLHRYLDETRRLTAALPLTSIRRVAAAFIAAAEAGRWVFVMGNGGSAATASHLANDLGKGGMRGFARRFKVIALTDNVPLLSAWANDVGYEDIFAEQLRNFAGPGDVVVGISGSGNSPNVLKALDLARAGRAVTVGLTGGAGGKLASLVDHCVTVASDDMQHIEDLHLVVCHLIYSQIRDEYMTRFHEPPRQTR